MCKPTLCGMYLGSCVVKVLPVATVFCMAWLGVFGFSLTVLLSLSLSVSISLSHCLTLSLHNFTNCSYTHFQEFTYPFRSYKCQACQARFLKVKLNALQMISVLPLYLWIDTEPTVKCDSFCNFIIHNFNVMVLATVLSKHETYVSLDENCTLLDY